MDMRFGGMVAIYGSHYGTAYGYLKSSMNGVDAETEVLLILPFGMA